MDDARTLPVHWLFQNWYRTKLKWKTRINESFGFVLHSGESDSISMTIGPLRASSTAPTPSATSAASASSSRASSAGCATPTPTPPRGVWATHSRWSRANRVSSRYYVLSFAVWASPVFSASDFVHRIVDVPSVAPPEVRDQQHFEQILNIRIKLREIETRQTSLVVQVVFAELFVFLSLDPNLNSRLELIVWRMQHARGFFALDEDELRQSLQRIQDAIRTKGHRRNATCWNDSRVDLVPSRWPPSEFGLIFAVKGWLWTQRTSPI